jgi:putative transposase
MPNHFHAIVVIHQPQTHLSNVSGSLTPKFVRQFSKPVSDSLSTIVGSFKSAVSKKIHQMQKLDTRVVWQRRFYDHIIRNENEYELIYKYIEQNPELWERDHNNPNAKEVIKGIKGLELLFKNKNKLNQ